MRNGNEKNDVWIVGAGVLSESYARILQDLGRNPIVIGRGAASAARFRESTGLTVIEGGVEAYLATIPTQPEAAIVVTGMEALAETASHLIDYGVTQILTEKPGALTYDELAALNRKANNVGATCIVGFNRRCYAAAEKVRAMLAKDGGAISFHFEFTELSDHIAPIAGTKAPVVLGRWAHGNSSHVLDLAFFLGGWPTELTAFADGTDVLDWHPENAVFAGAGKTETGALFSYIANWDGPGRWALELTSRLNRYILRPMETLSVIPRGTFNSVPIEIDDAIDLKFKHGLHLQTKRFLNLEHTELCLLSDQVDRWPLYSRIAGYPLGS